MKAFINDFSGFCNLGKNPKEILSNLAVQTNSIHKKTIRGKKFALAEIEETEDLSLFRDLPSHFHSRTNWILAQALLPMKESINKAISKYGQDRIAVVIGTTTSAVEENLKNLATTDSETFTKRNTLSNPSAFVAHIFGLKGLNFGISSACTSGGKALISAKELCDKNLCDAVICGGVDSLNTLTLFGFDSLEILSDTESLPFSKNRNGVNLGEGAGVFLLSPQESLIEFKGYGSNNDAFHITKPDESCRTQTEMLQNALEMAHLLPKDIDYINLHGTGTLANDKMEAKLLHSLFDATLCSSTKSAMGHTLGAAGALEAVVCLECLRQSAQEGVATLPIHRFDNAFDETLPQIALIQTAQKKKICNALSLSFAFGGDNCALIFGV